MLRSVIPSLVDQASRFAVVVASAALVLAVYILPYEQSPLRVSTEISTEGAMSRHWVSPR
jgi:hypothetical protein